MNGVLEELGLPKKTREFRVEVQIRAYQTVSIYVDAQDEQDAERQVDRYAIRGAIDSTEWEWDGEWESDDVSAEEA